MDIIATVLRVQPQGLLVKNSENNEEILVRLRNPRRFSPGERLRITFNGQMTRSIPPQITATAVQLLRPTMTPTRPIPNEMRARVIERGRGFLLVQNLRDQRRIRVLFPFSHHFCVRQQVVIQYDTMTLSIPPQITAIDISPVC